MPPQPPPFSWIIFLTLVVLLGTSMLMFLLLVRRWTTQRQWVSLAEWARAREFRFRPDHPEELPAALHPLRNNNVRLRLHLCREGVTAAQIQTDPPTEDLPPNLWNILVRRRPVRVPTPAGLRPASATASLLDLYGMSQFPTVSIGHRFAVLATSSMMARALAASASTTLMPSNVGLLLIDDWILLDFSSRPFDPVELDRMIALAQQISQMM